MSEKRDYIHIKMYTVIVARATLYYIYWLKKKQKNKFAP